MNGPAAIRAFAALRGVYGAGLLLLAEDRLSRLARMRLDRATLVTARILGARQLIQAGLLAGHPARSWQRAGAGVDALHAASMVWLARAGRSGPHRRLAARDARNAALLTAGDLLLG